jgi:hypothetical protein
MPASFAVTTTGFPFLSSQPVGPNPTPPTSPSQGKGMYFTITGLPADLHVSNLNPQGLATRTLIIEGTPSAADAGTYQVQITAQNGVGVPAQQDAEAGNPHHHRPRARFRQHLQRQLQRHLPRRRHRLRRTELHVSSAAASAATSP